MSKTYKQCSEEIQDQARTIMDNDHHELSKAGPTMLCLFVDAGYDEDGKAKPAITSNGYPCAGQVKLSSPQDRACGKADFIVLLDVIVWRNLEEKGRESLLDHEITHVEPVIDDETMEFKLTADERPVLKIRKHDLEIGIFHEVIERHGLAAIDSQAIAMVYASESGQAVFEFMEEVKKAQKKGKKAA